MEEFNPYVGLPWREHGRDRDGVDCWGVLRLIYLERLGIELPSYHSQYSTRADAVEVSRLLSAGVASWQPVPRGQEAAFDGVLLREGGMLRHIGVVVRPGKMLHITAALRQTVIEDYRGPWYRSRIAGFYRHRDAFRALERRTA